MKVKSIVFRKLLHFVFVISLISVLPEVVCAEKGVEPQQLADLRKGYVKTLKGKITPIQKYYLKHLNQLLGEYTREQKLDSALAVREEIKKITQLLTDKKSSAANTPNSSDATSDKVKAGQAKE